MSTDTIDLEGNALRIIQIGRADAVESTVLYIPSLAAVVTGGSCLHRGAYDDRCGR
jgi:hypothetical protein